MLENSEKYDFKKINSVALTRQSEYDENKLYTEIKRHFELLGINPSDYAGKRVVLKPNLLLKFTPERSATVHPSVVAAAGRIFVEAGANVILAESPGGPYTEGHLKAIYKTSGMEDAAKSAGFELNFDTSFKEVTSEGGERSNHYCVITPIEECDCIINLCKLKSHSMAMMTAGAKNLFGTIPGTLKVEYHSRFPKHPDFAAAVVDLTAYHCRTKKVITICDAIVGMDGNGPSAGNPKRLDCLMTSENPFALDLLAAYIIGAGNSVTMLENAKKRNFIPKDISGLQIFGDDPKTLVCRDFVFPDTQKKNSLNYLPKFLEPRPVVNKNICIGCGECARSCPQKTIEIKDHKAHIIKKNCIKCYCCQELCKPQAIKIHRNFIYKIIG